MTPVKPQARELAFSWSSTQKRIWTWVQTTILGRSDIYFGGALYMKRWRLGPRWGLGLRLHHIVRGDGDREFHDHPFWFLSFILSGGYVEHRPGGASRRFGPGSIVVRRATGLHRLELDRPAWTVVLRGPICRTWGFSTDRGWVPWHDFTAQREAEFTTTGEPGAYAAPSSLGMQRAKEQT